MKGPRYIEKNINLAKLRERYKKNAFNLNRQFDRHMKKLAEIQGPNPRLSTSICTSRMDCTQRGFSSLQKQRGFPTIDREFCRKKNNKNLLDKLVDISAGRYVRNSAQRL